jgi:A/G-specific adenine glycosylase
MAQQTRLESMLPYYTRWMRTFPTIRSLAVSKEQDVLNLWEGLGYYSRARNLRKAAQLVIDNHMGKLPSEVEVLLTLPGIGRYTAGAIASMAFGKDEAAVDGNAIRVLARVFNVKHVVGSSRAARSFWSLATEHLPRGRAADFNQALMDLGASICKPRQPDCRVCPLQSECQAYARGIQAKRPVKKAVSRVPPRNMTAVVLKRRRHVLLIQRPANGLLGGMWEFPNFLIKNPKTAKTLVRKEIRDRFGFTVNRAQNLGAYAHAYSHFTVNLQVFSFELSASFPKKAKRKAHRWISLSRLTELPMGKLDRQIALSLRDNAK